MTQAIRERATQISAIMSYVSTLTQGNSKTISEIHEHLRDRISGRQQVIDCIKKLKLQQQVCYVRHGKNGYSFWSKPISGCTVATPKPQEPKHSAVEVHKPAEIPKIHVTASLITISHSRYEITVELK